MSVDYFIIVPNRRWPTYRALNDALERQGFAVEVVRPPRALSHDPVAKFPQSLGLKVLLEGESVELEAGIEPMPAESGVLTDINLDLATYRAKRRASAGDSLLSLTLRSSTEEWVAACYLMATLVREFDAHGFETDEGTSGDAEWADLLVKGAECRFDYGEDENEAAAVAEAPAPTSQRALDGVRKWFGVLRWVAVLALVGLWLARGLHRAEEAGISPVEALTESFR